MSDKCVLLVQDDEGNYCAVLCNSWDRANGLRSTYEGSGVDTFGILRVVSFVDVMYDSKRYPR